MDIKITKSARACALCEKEFEHDEEIVSMVRISEGSLIREDFCKDEWKPDLGKEAYSFWNTRFYDPKVAEQEPAEVFSPLRQLFYEAVENEDRLEQAKAFLAAQLLRRQKAFLQIKESDEADGEVRTVLFADRIGNRLIEVRDPNFSFAEMEAGRQQLITRLQELEAPETEQPEEETTEHAVEAKNENTD